MTNTGEVAFAIIPDKGWLSWVTRFYRESDEDSQRLEDAAWAGQQREKNERQEVVNAYEFGMKKHSERMTMLQPGESVFQECEGFRFTLSETGWSEIYKAEMYLGDDTWLPVTISPPIGYIRHVSLAESDKDNVFVFAQEGTNQFLYLKTEGEFKRVGEMAVKSTPKKVDKEDAVTFVSPDGKTKKLTREQAAEIIREREQQNQ